MNNSDIEKIRNDIKAIGMKTFVDYYYDFKMLTTQEIKKLFENKERWNSNSINTKASIGQTIFKENNQKQALELIISSRSEQCAVEKASEIYLIEYPGSEIKHIRFIRPEFEFGQNIIAKLFEGYEIIPQYDVDGYKIDWYIPELKIAIEFDEKHHNKQTNTDLIRQSNIEKKLKCKFLRYKH